MKTLKAVIQEKVKGLAFIQPQASRFDDIRDELLSHGENLHEVIWCILNDSTKRPCKECGEPAKFDSLKNGYRDFCGVKCSNIYKGRDVSIKSKISKGVSNFNKTADQDFWDSRTANFLKTLGSESRDVKNMKKLNKSNAMKKMHSERTIEDRQIINNKISKAVTESKKARTQRIERSKMGAKALNDYRKTLKHEELKEFNKRCGSTDLIGGNRELFNQYYKLVWYYTNRNLPLVENIHKRSIEWHLDHKYSIRQGFLDNISPVIIGSAHNLEIVHNSVNLSKGTKCSIRKEDLLSPFQDSLNLAI